MTVSFYHNTGICKCCKHFMTFFVHTGHWGSQISVFSNGWRRNCKTTS